MRVSNQQRLLFPVVGVLVRVWMWLVRRGVTYDRRGPLYSYMQAGKPCIVALWHQDVMVLMADLFRFTPSYRPYFMVSDGRMGTFGSYLLSLWGIGQVAGSGPKHGVAAVKELGERARSEQKGIFIMADGSRGPARHARWGALYLARDTGLPIIAARAWGDNLVVLERTWMRLALPKPWGRSVVLTSAPLSVPAQAKSKTELEPYRAELESRLNAMADAAEAYFGEDVTAVDPWGPQWSEDGGAGLEAGQAGEGNR